MLTLSMDISLVHMLKNYPQKYFNRLIVLELKNWLSFKEFEFVKPSDIFLKSRLKVLCLSKKSIFLNVN